MCEQSMFDLIFINCINQMRFNVYASWVHVSLTDGYFPLLSILFWLNQMDETYILNRNRFILNLYTIKHLHL